MSIKENKALILRFYDLYNKRELDKCYEELVAPEFVLHAPNGGQTREQVKQFDTVALSAFPDSICTVSNIIAEGDKVAFRVSWKGTHKGKFMGVAPTGKSFQMHNTHIVKIRANKLVEWWGTTEIPLLMQQLGVIPKQQINEGTKMSLEENKELIYRYLSSDADEVHKATTAGIYDFHAPEFVSHRPTGDLKLMEYYQVLDASVTAFPDYKNTIEDIIAEGDKVVVRYRGTGTHKGAFFGIAPTGKKVSIEGIAILRIAGGRIVESWFVSDNLSTMQQLGVVPMQ